MKLNILQIWDHIYFEVYKTLDKPKAIEFSDKVILYYYTFPKDKEKFMFEVGKILKEYRIRDQRLKEYILKGYRTFCLV